jgi:small-conductance mechanosensitive channel
MSLHVHNSLLIIYYFTVRFFSAGVVGGVFQCNSVARMSNVSIHTLAKVIIIIIGSTALGGPWPPIEVS